VYQFTPDEVPPVDYEVANWYSNRHPRSHFQQNLIATRVLPQGRIGIFNREFTQRDRDGVAHKREIASHDELLRLLAEYFGLHFPVGTWFGAPSLVWPD
jgi:N-hydroxyarylamine O-acetyltransferase